MLHLRERKRNKHNNKVNRSHFLIEVTGALLESFYIVNYNVFYLADLVGKIMLFYVLFVFFYFKTERLLEKD